MGGRRTAHERGTFGGGAEAQPYGELGLAGTRKGCVTPVRGMVSDIWLRSTRWHACLGRAAAAHSSGGSSQVAGGNRSSNRRKAGLRSGIPNSSSGRLGEIHPHRR